MVMLENWILYASKHFDMAVHKKLRKLINHLDIELLVGEFEKLYHISSAFVELEISEFKENLKKLDIEYCTIFDLDYPIELKNIYDYPLCLYLRGNRAALSNQNKISVIGTRKPTHDGRKICEIFIRGLSKIPFTIVSGLAFGTDECAHRNALKYSCPAIAVLASGVDNITPKSNEKLGLEILRSNGLIISEYPPKSIVQKSNFVVRNRIISGLSMDLFVVEAGEKSGSLTTAKHAISQSRNIYAMPGSISNLVAYGTNWLIKQGAFPITCVEDYFEYKGMDLVQKQNFPDDELFECIRTRGKVSLDELMDEYALGYADLMPKLMEYEMKGLVEILGDVVQIL